MTFTTRIQEIGEMPRGPEALYEDYLEVRRVEDMVNLIEATKPIKSNKDPKMLFEDQFVDVVEEAERNAKELQEEVY